MGKKRNKKAKTIIKSVLLIFILLILIFSFFLFSNPKKRVVATDFDLSMFYLSVFDKTMSNTKNDDLLKSLINDNNDIKSLNVVSYYALVNNKYKLIPLLIEKCNHLKSLKKDSVWTIKISSRYYRESSTEMVFMENGLCENSDKLRNKLPAVKGKDY